MRLLGRRVVRARDLGRSHAWTLHHMVLEDGREVFVKKGGDFTAEARGLRWLGDPSVEVLEVGGGLLVLPWLPPEPATAPMAEETARALADVHRRGAPRFGADWPGDIAACRWTTRLRTAAGGSGTPNAGCCRTPGWRGTGASSPPRTSGRSRRR